MELCEAMLVAGCGVLLGEFFAIREELELLRQYRAAHLAHAAAKQDLQDIYRKHAIERA